MTTTEQDFGSSRYGPDYEERDCGYETPCWIWLKSTRDGKPVKHFGAHGREIATRYYYRKLKGRLFPGDCLYRNCRTHLCVRPDHMRISCATKEGRAGEPRQKPDAREPARPKQDNPLSKYVPTSNRKKYERSTHTYFIQAGPAGPIKVGKTADVNKRMAILQTGSAVPLQLLKCVPDRELEKIIHREFASSRMNGEWFHPTEKLLKRIASL